MVDLNSSSVVYIRMQMECNCTCKSGIVCCFVR